MQLPFKIPYNLIGGSELNEIQDNIQGVPIKNATLIFFLFFGMHYTTKII